MKDKVILIISDDPRHSSGVGNQCRHIVKKLAKDNKVIVVGVISANNVQVSFQEYTFDSGERITISNHNKYDDFGVLMYCMDRYKPDCLVLFTDPYRYFNIWVNASFVREKIPLYFIHVWDTYLIPASQGKHHFNLPIYENCDAIGCISRQTEWFVNEVYKKVQFTARPPITYVGHGSSPDVYKPLLKSDYVDLRQRILGNDHEKFKYVVLSANRNQSRKKFPDLVEAWSLFMDDQAHPEECALVLHTEPISEHGTNLIEVVAALAPKKNIIFSCERFDEENFNRLYNIADVVVNPANAEGFGLCTNESLLAGTPIISNSTGGLVDQIGFFDCGIPVQWTPEFKKNLTRYDHGKWSFPLVPQRTIIGSPDTPYLYDENSSIDDLVRGLMFWRNKSDQEREECGMAGRRWCIDRGLTSKDFSVNVVNDIENTINNFKPVKMFNIYNV